MSLDIRPKLVRLSCLLRLCMISMGITAGPVIIVSYRGGGEGVEGWRRSIDLLSKRGWNNKLNTLSYIEHKETW